MNNWRVSLEEKLLSLFFFQICAILNTCASYLNIKKYQRHLYLGKCQSLLNNQKYKSWFNIKGECEIFIIWVNNL